MIFLGGALVLLTGKSLVTRCNCKVCLHVAMIMGLLVTFHRFLGGLYRGQTVIKCCN